MYDFENQHKVKRHGLSRIRRGNENVLFQGFGVEVLIQS